MKQNTLYTINRWNKGGINKVRAAKFDDGGALWDRLASNAYGANYGDAGYTVDDYMNSKNAFGISKKNNPFSKGNIKGTMGSMAGIIGSIPTGERRGMFDTLDPLHHLAGGRESKVGNAVGDAGVGIFQMGAQTGNGALMLAGGIAKGIGSLINAGWGIKENKANIAAIDANTAAARNAGAQLGNASTNEDVLAASGNMVSGLGFKASDLYKNGWFTNKGTRKGNAKINTNNSALAFQTQGLATGVDNADYYSDSNTMRNFIGAFGGPLPAVDYNFMDRYLTAKEKQNELKSKLPGLTPMSGLLAFGGDMQTNSSDFSTGATHVNAGQSHELNPNGGVQMGVDSEGTPNLVEEGEVIYNDYVYSDRIQLDDEAKEKFHFSKKKDLTYAEAAKKLEKEISERPNDPLSQAAYKAQMEDLANEQERQKQEMEADRAREAFESLSDEDKVALMQQVAQEEQMAQQQAMEEQAMAEQQMMNPQVAQEVPQEAMIPQEVPVEAQTMAEGGNLYAPGGELLNPTSVYKDPVTGDLVVTQNSPYTKEVPTVPYYYKGQPYNTEDDYRLAIYDDANKYGIKTVNESIDSSGFVTSNVRPIEDVIRDIEAARKGIEGSPVIVESLKAVSPSTERVGVMPDAIKQEADNVYNKPTKTSKITDADTTGKKLAPVLKAEWPRYVGLFGPAVGLGLMAAGVGKPNKKQFDAILDAYDRTGTSLADYKTIGDYLTYRPMDIWAEQNRMNANARATDRAILNNSSPVGTRMAGLLASNYNDQIGSGQLYKNALEYNDSKAAQVAGFNRGTNQYNADTYNRAALANAQMRNQSRHYRAGLAMQAAAQKADMDAGWYNSLYGNIGQLFKGISDLGRENAERNMIARLATAGAFGNLPPENAVNAKLSKWVTAEGGKLKKSKKSKRKGLTF